MANIQKGYIAAHEIYGSPRLCIELTKKNVSISRTTTAKYMNELGVRSKLAKKFKNTTKSEDILH